MKSAQINKYGSSEVIEINQSTPESTVSPGKVLVTIKAAGVNPVDWKIREGGFQQLVSLQFPSTFVQDLNFMFVLNYLMLVWNILDYYLKEKMN
jgi:NADPH:quinone reductase-like Zn-dependent oxidoreductase